MKIPELASYRLPAVKNKKINRVSVVLVRDTDFKQCQNKIYFYFKTGYFFVFLDLDGDKLVVKKTVKVIRKVLCSQVDKDKAMRMFNKHGV